MLLNSTLISRVRKPSAEAEIAVPDITVLTFVISAEVAEDPNVDPKSFAADEVNTDAVKTQTPA